MLVPETDALNSPDSRGALAPHTRFGHQCELAACGPTSVHLSGWREKRQLPQGRAGRCDQLHPGAALAGVHRICDSFTFVA